MSFVPRALFTALVLLAASPAAAQSFPERPVRLVVPFEPGGGTDLVARVIADAMRPELGQNVIVLNRSGAGTVIGSDFVAKSPADGYTLLYSGIGMTFQPATSKQLPYDVKRDFQMVAITGLQPNILIVGPSVQSTALKDIIQLAKQKPGGLSYGTAGQGSGTHIASDMLWQALGLEMLHVPYRGTSPALNDLNGGRIDLMFTTLSSVAAQVQGGYLRAVGVSSRQRSPMLPDVPTIAEQGAGGFDYTNWSSILAPAGTPPEVIRILGSAVAKALASKSVIEKLDQQGVEVSPPSDPVRAHAFYLGEIDRWTEVIRKAGIQPQ
jgi:tripartite-type tricarboxylate transporter receptor subunit TctC